MKTSEIKFIDSIEQIVIENRCVFIIDQLVLNLNKSKIISLTQNFPIYKFIALEKNKTLIEIEKIYDFLTENNVTRNTIIYAVGGGITTDIAAFAASTFKRGCRLQLIPSTFLGMIDAAIGGKTAINFGNVKNEIGTFYPAEKVYLHPDFLKTLPNKELQNGWAECIKIALIENGNLLDILENRKQEITSRIIDKAIKLKQAIVEIDLHDKCERRKLNLGHTFAHVLESVSNYEISHGNAVSIGILLAAKYSKTDNLISDKKLNKVISILKKYELIIDIPSDLKFKISKEGKLLLLQDKKATDTINLILFQNNKIIEKQVQAPDKIIEFMIDQL